MFGYLRVEGRHGRTALAPAQCGLCGHFGAAYRTRTRWLAGFDPSVLLLVLDGLGEVPAPRAALRCPIPLASDRTALDPEWLGVRVVAAIQLFLAAEKLFDDRLDRDQWTARLASGALSSDIDRAETWLAGAGFPLEEARDTFRRQAALEADPAADLDALSEPTARGLSLVLSWCGRILERPAQGRLHTFADRLGRTLYLVDALHDAPRDRALGAFNPIQQSLGGVRSPAAAAYLRGALDGRIAAMQAAFDALPLHRHREVLQAATCDSLDRRGHMALSRLATSPPIRALLEVPR